MVNRHGFNSLLAVSSIESAKCYYQEFKNQKNAMKHNLKVALIYSYCVNNDNQGDNIIDEDSDDTALLNTPDRDFLDGAINDYNTMFNTQCDTNNFANYYRDVSKRVKNGDIDILIVVNMFLTGFDAITLNTLWVDKNLKQHGLIQAFSRTNRIFNNVKSNGNIVCFRNLKKEVDDAIALFGDKDACGIVVLKTYKEYYEGYDEKDKNDKMKHYSGYKEIVEKLYNEFKLQEEIISESKQKEFIKLFGSILRLQNILSSFDEFEGNEILTEADFQDYLSWYNDLYENFKSTREKEDVTNDIIFEMELVKQVVVNIDYILKLVEKYKKQNRKDKEIMAEIKRAILSNPETRSKKELIEEFIKIINLNEDFLKQWTEYKKKNARKEIKEMISEGYGNKPLKEKETKELVEKMFRNNIQEPSNSDVSKIIPGFNPITKSKIIEEAKQVMKEKLKNFYLKYMD